MCACALQPAAHTHIQHTRSRTYTACTHTHMRKNIHGNAHTQTHTHTQTYTRTHTHTNTHVRAHTSRQDKGSDTYKESAHARHAHTVRQDKGSDTLAELRCYVFKHNGYAIHTRAGKNTHTCAHTAATLALKHNGSAIATRAGKNTNARAHTAATLAQVRLYVFKHNCSTIDKLSQVTCSVYRL